MIQAIFIFVLVFAGLISTLGIFNNFEDEVNSIELSESFPESLVTLESTPAYYISIDTYDPTDTACASTPIQTQYLAAEICYSVKSSSGKALGRSILYAGNRASHGEGIYYLEYSATVPCTGYTLTSVDVNPTHEYFLGTTSATCSVIASADLGGLEVRNQLSIVASSALPSHATVPSYGFIVGYSSASTCSSKTGVIYSLQNFMLQYCYDFSSISPFQTSKSTCESKKLVTRFYSASSSCTGTQTKTAVALKGTNLVNTAYCNKPGLAIGGVAPILDLDGHVVNVFYGYQDVFFPSQCALATSGVTSPNVGANSGSGVVKTKLKILPPVTASRI